MAEREIVKTDVLIVGGGPSGLAAAIHLTDLINAHNQKIKNNEAKGSLLPLNVLLIEKGASIGSHSLSGALINPSIFKKLLPDIAEQDIPFDSPILKDEVWFFTKNLFFRLPYHPPHMNNQGNYIASLGKVVRWLSEIAEKKGVQVFSGFSGHELLYEKSRVVGVQTGDSGIDRHGNQKPNYQPGTQVHAKVTILAEGARGHLTKGLVEKMGLAKDSNPQVYSVGVKELWEVPEKAFERGRILHTLGYPLNFEQFGGGFVYGLSKDPSLAKIKVAVGLVMGLDYRDPTFDPHHAFQIYKTHPFIKALLKDGKMLRYGAKTIPEGGFFSLPRLYHDGALIVGDSAGFVSMPSLKGIHLGIESGMLAAQTAFEALKKNDSSQSQLARYDELFKKSEIFQDLRRVRNFRQGFKKNLLFGAVHFASQLVTGGHGLSLSGRLKIEEDGKCYRKLTQLKNRGFLNKFKNKFAFDKKLTFDKATDIFFSGTQHDEDQPCHLVVPSLDLCRNVCIPKYGGPCQHFCPAEVYEIVTDPKTGGKDLHLHPTNCVHCKTCDIKDPLCNIRWTTPYGGDGPNYENL